jgi:putative ABC transport system substrate-binding protein
MNFQAGLGRPASFRSVRAAGALMSYGGNVVDAHRWFGVSPGRIFLGEKPGELPVQQSTKVEMFLNLRTAKALGRVGERSGAARF